MSVILSGTMVVPRFDHDFRTSSGILCGGPFWVRLLLPVFGSFHRYLVIDGRVLIEFWLFGIIRVKVPIENIDLGEHSMLWNEFEPLLLFDWSQTGTASRYITEYGDEVEITGTKDSRHLSGILNYRPGRDPEILIDAVNGTISAVQDGYLRLKKELLGARVFLVR